MNLEQAIELCPLIAILRGVRPSEVVFIGQALIDSGFTCLEVPLNSPEDPFESIYHLSKAFKGRALVGAGTVLRKDHVVEVAKAGGRLIVMPHADPQIICTSKENGLYCLPGFSTPTEAFAALAAGADALKYFPASSPAALSAMKAVLPPDTKIFPVGGINLDNMESYMRAGAAGFGLGTALYKPGDYSASVAKSARSFYDRICHISESTK